MDVANTLVVADDLSGAAEVAAVIGMRTTRSLVLLGLDPSFPPDDDDVIVVDLDVRSGPSHAAEAETARAVTALGASRQVFVKVDSLLRGHVAAAVRGAGGFAVVCPALPRLGRVVRGGVVRLDDVPLHETDAWRVEPTAPPRSIAEVLTQPTAVVPLADVRAPDLATRLCAIRATGAVAVCDAETDADLSLIAAAGTAVGAVLVGSAGLAEALGDGPSTATPEPGTAVLVVVGTAAAAAQVEHLRTTDFTVLTTATGDLAALADEAAFEAAWQPTADLVLTGGETARAVLDRLGVTRLTVHGALAGHHGAVLSTTPDGRRVVTRPGSFGAPDSLTAIAAALHGGTHVSTTSPDTRPFIAVTMGDGAGIGPEVVVGALLDEGLAAECRPVVIGDAARLRLGAEALGVTADVVAVESVRDAVFTPGRVNVIDLGLLPADLQWGELSAVAGDAAFHYIRVAAELAMAGTVQGICTAPLNKEALHAGGHVYPGHTELLAHLTGTEEVSMMLSTPKVKVIHVTTHIGLVDAVRKIEPGLVERTVRRGHEALVRAGVPEPKIGVCAINPHAGENGLFGQGEEAEKITPAIEVLQADGIDARGPLPADTAFFLAGRGDYDLIVAMYHDQGHGPVKVLGIEAGVNITVGLPVIRTSVDHGTAFDIAGKGVADIRSMIEALHQAARMSPSPS